MRNFATLLLEIVRLRFVVVFVSAVAAMAVGAISQADELSPSVHVRNGKHPADLVVLNATILTSDSKHATAQALAAKDKRFTFVGSNADAEDFIGPNTQVIDARGHLLVPGFIDSHSHHLWVGALRPWIVSLYDVQDFDTLKAKLIAFAKAHPPDQAPFLLGAGWRYYYLPGQKPTAAALDAITSDPAFAGRPVFLWGIGGQVGWVNSAALRRMQADAAKSKVFRELDPEIDQTSGKPTGVLRQFHAFDPFEFFAVTNAMQQKMLASMRARMAKLLSFGVTAFDELEVHERFLDTLLKFKAVGGFDNIRMRGNLYVSHYILGENGEETALVAKLKRWKAFGRANNSDHFWMGDGIKLYSDGVLTLHNAWMMQPYADKPGVVGGPAWRSMADFTRVVAISDRMGIQVATHAVGDRAIKEVVSAYIAAQKANGGSQIHHRIEHNELALKEDQVRMARHHILAAMQPAHFYADADVERVLGVPRLSRSHPWASLTAAGVDISFGSDWMAGPDNPLYGLFVAATRLNYHHETDWGPEQAIDLATGIHDYTIGSARALEREREIGSIEVGKFADFVLFDVDIREMTSSWFLLFHKAELGAFDNFVLLTAVDGKIVYKKPDLEY